MGRPHRIDSPGTWYHVLNRGVARQDIFFDDRDRVEFERLLGEASDRFAIRIHAYCLMTNHYHLLVECPDGGLSDAMHLLGSVYVRHVNERQGRDGPLFRDRFHAKLVMSDAYLLRLVRYIHRNPLAFSTIDQLRSYRWSSLRIYLGRRRTPRWMTTDVVLGMFDGVDGLDYHVTGATPRDMPPLEPRSWASAIDLTVEERLGDRAHQGAAKTIAVLLLDRLDDHNRSSLASTLAFPTPDAERAARYRARRLAARCPDLQNVVDGVLELLA